MHPVQIAVHCPACQTRYFLKPEMRGKYIRCQNAQCRRIFEVRDAEAGGNSNADTASQAPPQPSVPDSAAATPSITGSVGEVVPLVHGEPGDSDTNPSEAEETSKAGAEEIPRPDRRGSRPEPAPPGSTGRREVRGSSAPTDGGPSGPGVSPPIVPPSWQAQPPPVRTRGDASKTAPGASGSATPLPQPAKDQRWAEFQPAVQAKTGASAPNSDTGPPLALPPLMKLPARPASRKRRNKLLMVVILILFGAAGAGIWEWYRSAEQVNESAEYEKATSEYQVGQYRQARDDFRILTANFPESVQLPEYQFMADLAELRAEVTSAEIPSEDSLSRVVHFIDEHKTSSYLKVHGRDIAESLNRIARNLALDARGMMNNRRQLDRAGQLLSKARQAWALGLKYSGPGTQSDPELTDLLEAVGLQLARAIEVRDTLQTLAQMKPTTENLQAAERLLRRMRLESDREAQAALETIRQGILAHVTFDPSDQQLPATGPLPRAAYPSILVALPNRMAAQARSASGQTIFAVARGVVYGMAASTGEVRWAARAGIDTFGLPVRTAAQGSTPEIALVLSSDTNMLTARDARDGHEIWHFDLGAPCLGRPLVVNEELYVPTFDGTIHVIDVPSGRHFGRYRVGSPLAGFGAFDPNTNLLYFPGIAANVFVMQRIEKRCVGILETGHPSGSLRGRPLIANTTTPGSNGEQAGYLILSQADSLDTTRLVAYPLPIVGMAPPAPAEPELRFPGWPWFAPAFDGEKIALVTDLGSPVLVGVDQANNSDRPLFPLITPETLEHPGQPWSQMQRSQVVHAEDHDFWILAHGSLSHFHLGLDRQHGLILNRDGKEVTGLGTPLHTGQVSEDRQTLYVVTQSASDRECLASAVAAVGGETLWQRRLGEVCLRDPISVAGAVITLDQGGALVRFDPASQSPMLEGWRRGGEMLADAITGELEKPVLVSSRDAKSWYEFASRAHGGVDHESRSVDLVVRQLREGEKEVWERVYPVRQRIQGTPGVAPDWCILPLASGELYRQPWDGTGRAGGVSWRSPKADAGAPGHILWMGGDDFVATDGARGLSRWKWRAGDVPAVENSAEEMPDRISGPPILVAEKTSSGSPFVCVADVSGTVRFLRAGDLKVVRSWSLRGSVCCGPFARAGGIGCVVNKNRLVWLAPEREEPLWVYQAHDAIAGEPNIVGGMLVIADISGRVVGVNPVNGKAKGPGVMLEGTVIPMGAPVAFGGDELFVPLSDGTVALLPQAKVR